MGYQFINDHTEGDNYPTPSVPEVLRKFTEQTVYSSFDIIKAFFNIRVAPESRNRLREKMGRVRVDLYAVRGEEQPGGVGQS